MGSIPLLRPKEVVKVFERLGWEMARQRGSHIIMTKPGHLATPFPSPIITLSPAAPCAASWPRAEYLWKNF